MQILGDESTGLFTKWLDFSNEMFYQIFSKEGLSYIFEATEKTACKMADDAEENGDENTAFNLRRYVSTKDYWIKWIDFIVASLCDGNKIYSTRELFHQFLYSPFAPRGNRMEQYLSNIEKEATIDENNKLTMVCNWIDRTEPIPSAAANPVCILTGIKVEPAENAIWDENELVVLNSGDISYDIYLRASSLYSVALKEENQKQFGLIPYVTDKTGWEGGTEKGAHFSSTYADFEDSFILDKTVRQGWYTENGKDYYYVVRAYAKTEQGYIYGKYEKIKCNCASSNGSVYGFLSFIGNYI